MKKDPPDHIIYSVQIALLNLFSKPGLMRVSRLVKDTNILLSAIFIFRGLILLLVAETSEQHKYLVIIIIIPNIGVMVLKMTGLNPVFQCKNQF